MLFRKGHIFSLLTVMIVTASLLYSCSPVDLDFNPNPAPGRTEEDFDREPVKEYRNVFLMYSMGFNDLLEFLAEDIDDVLNGPLMKNTRDVVLICSHIAKYEYRGYRQLPFYPSNHVSPTLTKISRRPDGSIQRDTLLVMDEDAEAASSDVLHEVLTYTKENFDAENYGILLSSHGSGWAPEGYLADPDYFEELIPMSLPRRKYAPGFYQRREDDIPVKSIGVHYISDDETVEMNITDLADAFPFKMDYIIFDACFMGGVEVAYELRNVTDRLVFSQTEILGDGMDYKTMTTYLFDNDGPDLEGFCQRYYDYYNKQSGVFKSATISLVDCSRLESLAQTTQTLLDKYRDGLNNLTTTRNVQKYYRSSYPYVQKHCWFYDFGDIIEKCGLSEEDKALFNEKLDDVILYKAATQWFMSDFKVEHHSGLSMYLPYMVDRDYLNNFYKGLEWNKAVGLVQ